MAEWLKALVLKTSVPSGTVSSNLTASATNQQMRRPMPSSSFVLKKSTHFCYKCGWIDQLEVTMEKKTYKDLDGNQQTDYYHIKTDQYMECPDCAKRSVMPLTIANTPHAIEYLMRALKN